MKQQYKLTSFLEGENRLIHRHSHRKSTEGNMPNVTKMTALMCPFSIYRALIMCWAVHLYSHCCGEAFIA
jgi:hypothetical protein